MWITNEEYNVLLAGYSGASTDSVTTAETCKSANLGRYTSMLAIVTVGSTNAVTTSNLFVMEASTVSAVGQATGVYSYRKASTADTPDTFGSWASGASTATAIPSTPGTVTVVAVKSDDLSAGYPYCYVSVSSAAAARMLTVHYILKPRYPQQTMWTALS